MMEGEPPRMKVSTLGDENTGSLLGEDDSPGQELNYAHATQLPEEEEYDPQDWNGSASEKCNLIVNYLPPEIDDITLKVGNTYLSFILS